MLILAIFMTPALHFDEILPVVGQGHSVLHTVCSRHLIFISFTTELNGEQNEKGGPVAEWLRPLFFSALNHPFHRCGFEPSSGHMKQAVLLAGGQVFFLGHHPFFAPPYD